ncbi:hypothetical protein MVLG_06754 [Microbotryum lychnidis-dioicae p1A1 Lamole]|uniref:Uncharacterized protein n=1 Tax=Microbotryum lychnidis-dioicae (strain p1A1 Lamole / MvSl-1064) TaxID=683840 RepID=U5HI90_USTV1|nr:hypothetical protein MVLG_06754 [Microbotryum lychnidis-dioicae p1A1 Lamole]|eukprot:KDE02710.1 hypothetical protein MVLG_06754 [Microbotryum lychnidis-dioicae p1A1 Lamole]
MSTTLPLVTGANPTIPAEQLAALTSLPLPALLHLPQHPAPLVLPFQSMHTWMVQRSQLCLCLADDIRLYILNGIVPANWTPLQRSARDVVACEILANLIDSAEVLAVLDKIPTGELTAPKIYSTLKSVEWMPKKFRTWDVATAEATGGASM